MKDIIIFTDGAVPNNQKIGNRKGGMGVFFGENDPRNISYSIKESSILKVTNQVCELLACIKGIKKLEEIILLLEQIQCTLLIQLMIGLKNGRKIIGKSLIIK